MQEQTVRYSILTAIAALAAMTVSAPPVLSAPLSAKPHSAPAVTRVADLDRPGSLRWPRHRHADAYWQWRYRAAYARWLHNEYVRAGYPVRHYRPYTYARVDTCCCCAYRRHW
jgi:hypothetical protein